jgi:hypothetical protein
MSKKQFEDVCCKHDASMGNKMEKIKQEGEKIAKQLGLKLAKGYQEPNLRWEMGVFGTQTGIGVYQVIKRLADESQDNVKNSTQEEGTFEWISHNPFANDEQTYNHD